MLEGRVEASAATEESVSRQAHAEQLEGKVALVAGQQLHLGEGSQPVMLSDRELQEQTDWQNGWLHVSAMSLKDLVSYLQPYSARQFRIADGGLDDLTVSGSFNRDDLDAVLAALEALLPVTIRKRSSEIVILQE